jgi:hypothetical protein
MYNPRIVARKNARTVRPCPGARQKRDQDIHMRIACCAASQDLRRRRDGEVT